MQILEYRWPFAAAAAAAADVGGAAFQFPFRILSIACALSS